MIDGRVADVLGLQLQLQFRGMPHGKFRIHSQGLSHGIGQSSAS